MEGLSRRQQDVLGVIQNLVRGEGRFPSVREIGRALRISSPATVSQHLQALVRKGFLERSGRHYVLTQDLRNVGPAIPVLGRVAAGQPIAAEEHVEEHIELGSLAGSGAGRTFAVKVIGDSMIEAGIFEGDYVVVEPTQEPRNGEIVVAYLGSDQEVTVKRYHRTVSGVELRPENRNFETIHVRNDPYFRIAGRVTELIRRF